MLHGVVCHRKWDRQTKGDFYLTAICHRRDIKSLRDLTAAELPLLKNIQASVPNILRCPQFADFGLTPDQVRVFIHYQPSYYHFHVHITSLQCASAGDSD